MTVIALAGSTTQNSGAVPTVSLPLTKAAPEKCPGVQKALRYYTKRWQHWMSLRTGVAPTSLPSKARGCPRYLLAVRKAKARAAQRAWHYHWAWFDWLPEKFQRVGACETGYGKRPGSWTWDSGTYVSAFGIIRAGFNQFAGYAGVHSWPDKKHPGPIPTPREQFIVAAALQARYGWSAWGCANA